jgi:hypothetical protein
MYLEISARQTGKTSRLVEAAAQCFMEELNNNTQKHIVLVGHNHQNAREIDFRVRALIQESVNIRNKELINVALKERLHYTTDLRKYVENSSRFRGTTHGDLYSKDWLNNWKVFYDEFDFIEVKPGHPIYIANDGYYCTTAKKTRTLDDLVQHAMGKPDALLDLLRANNGKHVTYAVTNFLENMTLKQIRELGKQMPEGYSDMEFGNSYIKAW